MAQEGQWEWYETPGLLCVSHWWDRVTEDEERREPECQLSRRGVMVLAPWPTSWPRPQRLRSATGKIPSAVVPQDSHKTWENWDGKLSYSSWDDTLSFGMTR